MQNRFIELLAVLEGDTSFRHLELSEKRRQTIMDALRIAAEYVPLAPIPNATDDEKKIVGKLVIDLLAADFVLSVNDGEEICLKKSTDAAAIFAALGSTGEDYLIAHGKGDRWVRLIWGNGVDVISDYHVSLDRYLAGANALANELDS